MQTLDDNRPLDPKEWALTIFISSLPLIGIIMLLVWAFGDGSNIHKKNWAKGTLILWVIGFIIAFAFLFFFGGIAIMSQLFN
ncbi:hypothetical protein [Lutimonas sp.]|uniref:hypothetical protein n=1 Tax=Lutimonas sp. TaxID=1872403 RepID=UPI003C765104